MSLSSETDARETIRLILGPNSTDSDYDSGTKPSIIEAVEQSPQNTKQKQPSGTDAIYLWSPTETDIGKFASSGVDKRETAIVQAECWTKTSASHADALAEDVQTITGGYSNDVQRNSQWVDIYPAAESDLRSEKIPRNADHFITAVQIRLRRKAPL